jgi:hypothetical protein
VILRRRAIHKNELRDVVMVNPLQWISLKKRQAAFPANAGGFGDSCVENRGSEQFQSRCQKPRETVL